MTHQQAGALGGRVKSDKKAEAARANLAKRTSKGGRPKGSKTRNRQPEEGR